MTPRVPHAPASLRARLLHCRPSKCRGNPHSQSVTRAMATRVSFEGWITIDRKMMPARTLARQADDIILKPRPLRGDALLRRFASILRIGLSDPHTPLRSNLCP
jgi:hypothetical protein